MGFNSQACAPEMYSRSLLRLSTGLRVNDTTAAIAVLEGL